MKANRKFVEGEEAVSAVIGVILMVAITVAIAAAVYVYVSGMIGGTTQHTPTISCVVNNDENTLMVSSAESGISWGDIKIMADKSGFTMTFSGSFTGDSKSIPTTATELDDSSLWGTSAANADVTAGDTFTISGSGDVKITLIYAPTNSVLGTWTVNV